MKINEERVNNYIKFLVISVDMLILGDKDEEADDALNKLTQVFTSLRVHPAIATKEINKLREETQKGIDKLGLEGFSLSIMPFINEMDKEVNEFNNFCEYHNNK